MKNKGTLVEHRSYVFTPNNLAAFRKKVAAGLKPDKVPEASLGSPMMDLLLEIIAKNPGIVARNAIAEMRRMETEEGLALPKNNGSAFNAIARLKKSEMVEAFGYLERQLRVGPKAPDKVKRMARTGVVIPLARRNEAPGFRPGASEADREPTLSFQNPAASGAEERRK